MLLHRVGKGSPCPRAMLSKAEAVQTVGLEVGEGCARGSAVSGSLCYSSRQEGPAQRPFSQLHSPAKGLVVVVWD